ncbi:MAG: restriction endonuclease [Chloroflexi bacterium]|nr:restriction endonuclease [Chloroflexota bacterium]MCY4248227.1 restriction endonuclease [Chloroflexota bacterium]
MAALFLKLAQPDELGFSRSVGIEEFVGEYQRLQLGNGGSWCRDDGPLARKYNIRRRKAGSRIVAIELQGFKKIAIEKPIPEWIRERLKNERCVVLDTSKVEIDHKDGRRDDPRLSDTASVTLDDFQPLSKAANNAKRQHCKTCRDTGQRYDAKRLGFPIAQFKGNGQYNGTCIGCYWHDPKAFIRAASANK